MPLRDKVFSIVSGLSHIYEDDTFNGYDEIDSSWVAWQRKMWGATEKDAERGPSSAPRSKCYPPILPPEVHAHAKMANIWVDRLNPEICTRMFLVFAHLEDSNYVCIGNLSCLRSDRTKHLPRLQIQ